MATDWTSEAVPVLRAVYELQREGSPAQLHSGVRVAALRERLDFDEDRAGRALIDLVESGYLSMPFFTDTDPVPIAVRLTEKGLQAVANWPAVPGLGSYDVLLAAIAERAEGAGTEEERSRWRGVRDGLLSLGRETVTEVLAKMAAGQVPGLS